MNYSPHIVGFLDILGFSEICDRSEKSESELNKLKEIFNLCHEIPTRFSHLEGKSRIKSMMISDSIVLSLRLLNDKPILSELANFFLACGQFQFYLGKKGFWLRGGIAVGSLNVDIERKQVVGPALIKAINLEKMVARFPRIVVDSKVMTEAGFTEAADFRNEINQLYAEENQRSLFEWRGFMDDWGEPNIPKDVPFIIDFMRSVADEECNVLEFAEGVAEGLRGPIAYYEKYRWLADYILAGDRQKYAGGLSRHRDKLKNILG